jgi:hypothetical protein
LPARFFTYLITLKGIGCKQISGNLAFKSLPLHDQC